MSSKEWKLPLNLAIGFHVLIALAAVYLPDILDSRPRFEDIYTVNLVNIAEAPPSQPQPAETPAPPPEPAAEKIAEKGISLAEPVPVAPPAPPKAVSIKPSKRKLKNETPPPPKASNKDLSRLRRQKLAEMIRAEQQAAEEARILAEEAEIEKRLAEAALRRLNKAASDTPTTGPSTTLRSTNQLTALENQYYAAVVAKLQVFWSLPEYKTWEPSLRATIVITVNKNGRIADSFFEAQSGDRIFDRFVTKALQDVGQLPPIPPAMKKERMEIGLNFTPGGIR